MRVLLQRPCTGVGARSSPRPGGCATARSSWPLPASWSLSTMSKSKRLQVCSSSFVPPPSTHYSGLSRKHGFAFFHQQSSSSPASSFVLERDDFCSGSWYRHEHQFLFTLLPVSVLALAFELSSQLTSLRSLLQAMPCCMVFACSPALLPSSDVFPFNTVPNPEVLSATQLLTAMQSVLLTGWGAHPVLSAQLLFDSPIP